MDKRIAVTCIHFVRCNVTKNCTNEQCMKCRYYEGYNFRKDKTCT